MSHAIYDLACSPSRHNSFIFVKMFSSMDISASYGLNQMEKRVHKILTSLLEHNAVHPLDEEWLSAALVLLKSGRFYTAPVIDCFMSHQFRIEACG